MKKAIAESTIFYGFSVYFMLTVSNVIRRAINPRKTDPNKESTVQNSKSNGSSKFKRNTEH